MTAHPKEKAMPHRGKKPYKSKSGKVVRPKKKAKKPKKRASPSFTEYGLTVAKKHEQITTARGFTPN